jgi:hypothetical protein
VKKMSKEKFREVKFRGQIKVKYTAGDGSVKYWTADSADLLDKIQNIINEYVDQNITLTNRQLYYQLVAGDIIPNAMEVYKRICTFLTDARYGGFLDWDAIEDRGRSVEKPSEWDNVKRLIESAVYSFRLPRWSDQDKYVELFCEKEAMGSVFKPIADKYHIYFGANKGYSSASTMYELAQRVKEQISDGKKCVILYAGDHDPSGVDMIRDIRERIIEFLTKGDEPIEDSEGLPIEDYDDAVDEYFKVIPIALNMTQIKQYNPPPNPAKITDPRAKGYIARFGNISWELDALNPKILMGIAERHIKEHLDIEKYEAWIEKENSQKQALKEFGNKLAKE